MYAEKLPDGRLRIPMRAFDFDTGTVGDGSAVIAPDHPEYDRWLADAEAGAKAAHRPPGPGGPDPDIFEAGPTREDKSGLVPKQITDKLGRKRTVMVRPGESHPDEHPAAGDDHPDAPALDHVGDGLAETLDRAEPGLTRRPGLLGRIEHAAVKAGARVYLFLLKNFDHIAKYGDLLGNIVDLPSDMQKFGYNPSTTGGTQTAATGHDPAKAAGSPVSGHIVAKVAAVVLVKGISWAAKKLKGKASESAAGDSTAVLVEALHGAMSAVAESLGVTPPDRDAVEQLVRALQAK